MSVVVVKVGGAAALESGAVRDLVFQKHKVVLVHGAGPQISAELARRGLSVEFVRGRRVTSAAALEVVCEALAEVNASLCAALGARAVPVPEGALTAVPVPELGFVGDPLPSAPQVVVDALAVNLVPVVAPLGCSHDDGGPLNVNGDEAAVALALGLGAERIVFVSDVPGVYVDGAVAPELRAIDAERLAGSWEGGIVPKLLAAARAARHGLSAEIGATVVTA